MSCFLAEIVYEVDEGINIGSIPASGFVSVTFRSIYKLKLKIFSRQTYSYVEFQKRTPGVSIR